MYIGMEHLSGGSLAELIKLVYESGSKITPLDASKIIKEILEAVAYIHGYDTAHRDLKPGNYLITKENIMFAKKSNIASLKIIDFGLSATYNNKNNSILTDKCGTAIYMAPEIFTN